MICYLCNAFKGSKVQIRCRQKGTHVILRNNLFSTSGPHGQNITKIINPKRHCASSLERCKCWGSFAREVGGWASEPSSRWHVNWLQKYHVLLWAVSNSFATLPMMLACQDVGGCMELLYPKFWPKIPSPICIIALQGFWPIFINFQSSLKIHNFSKSRAVYFWTLNLVIDQC